MGDIAARTETLMVSSITFGGGYLLGQGKWLGWIVVGFLIWLCITTIKGGWEEYKFEKEKRIQDERLRHKLNKSHLEE